MALAIENDWEMVHLDVVGAYLNSILDTPIYMEQAPSFALVDARMYVCMLKRSVYGLKQAGRNWNHHLHNILLTQGFKQCIKNPCVYLKPDLIIAVYVDDLLLLGKKEYIEETKRKLCDCLDIKDLGDISNFLSINIDRPSRKQLIINLSSYIEEILQDFSMSSCKGLSAPLEVGCVNVEKDENNKFCQNIYREAVGSLLYVGGTVRADIANAVCLVSQFCEEPVVADWKNIKHILQYLKSTKHYGLQFEKTGEPVKIFTDADWANSKSDAKSISGHVFILAGAVVCWRSRKQKCVATSSTHAEYIAMFECIMEFEWLKGLLQELGQERFVPKPCTIFADNIGAMRIADSSAISDRSKHINVKYHYIRQLVQSEDVVFQYVKSNENVADLLTKPLSGPKTQEFARKLGIF